MNALKTSLLASTIALALGATACNAQPAGSAADAAMTTASASAADDADRTVGQAVDDAAITASVKSRLLADERTKGFDINVDTVRGTVTLTGGADSLDAKLAAGKIAGEAEGVILVDNRLMVATEGSELRQDANTATASGEVREAMDEAGDSADDAWITSKVKAQLLADTAVKGTQIDVDTQANVVTLTGTADSAAARDMAIKIAANTKGVKNVIADQLLVKQ
ncbi:MAG TPA: BON domain-containing protein [Arenimonas sp.]|uniref:BON domain-containing protein n=1 Tax=Arenimonas sp. TaxID=1872635 RepID=UPI002D809043|nr:BON domain-containing protein [Arenimonas sp.]HEU0153523.1 BON domain-containing protein [Arenimonas sp.]